VADQVLDVSLVPPWSVIPGGRAVAVTQSLAGGELGERLALAEDALVDFFDHLVVTHGAPTHVGIEKPHAFNLSRIPVRQYELQGIIFAALWRVVQTTEVGLVSPSSWKASAMGKGNGHAKPPAYVAWAQRTFDWAPSRERPDDEAAALGIATHVALQAAGGSVLRGRPVWGMDPQMPRVSVAVLVPG
jgi:hypothetical protein